MEVWKFFIFDKIFYALLSKKISYYQLSICTRWSGEGVWRTYQESVLGLRTLLRLFFGMQNRYFIFIFFKNFSIIADFHEAESTIVLSQRHNSSDHFYLFFNNFSWVLADFITVFRIPVNILPNFRMIFYSNFDNF